MVSEVFSGFGVSLLAEYEEEAVKQCWIGSGVLRCDRVRVLHRSMETKMYISNEAQNNGHATTKYASTNSIPSMMEDESSFGKLIGQRRDSSVILRDNKGRRHSVLEDLKARRDSLFQKARRGSVVEEKENAKLVQKEKRRSSDSGRRGSVFYVSQDLLEENQEVLEDERTQDLEGKKDRRKSWHPLAKPPKLDRKRRKGIAGVPTQVGSTDGLYTQARQKRPSWWNIFVPDSVTRYLSHLTCSLLSPAGNSNGSTRGIEFRRLRVETANFAFEVKRGMLISTSTNRISGLQQSPPVSM